MHASAKAPKCAVKKQEDQNIAQSPRYNAKYHGIQKISGNSYSIFNPILILFIAFLMFGMI